MVGDKVYKIDDADKVKDHFGHKVVITGKADGDTLKVDSVKMAGKVQLFSGQATRPWWSAPPIILMGLY